MINPFDTTRLSYKLQFENHVMKNAWGIGDLQKEEIRAAFPWSTDDDIHYVGRLASFAKNDEMDEMNNA